MLLSSTSRLLLVIMVGAVSGLVTAGARPGGSLGSSRQTPAAIPGRWQLPTKPPGPAAAHLDPTDVRHPFLAPITPYGPGHRGVDLQEPLDRTIRSPNAGQVTFSGDVAGRGVVVVRHRGGLRSTLEPVDASVHVGQRVAAGDVLGTLAPHGAHCSKHDCLHWGVRLPDDSYLDPLLLLDAVHAVLLPE